jgi:hypothetical protein
MTWETMADLAQRYSLPAKPEQKSAWTKEQIRLARRTPLAPILKDRGYPLRILPNDNLLVEDEKDLVVKDSYWIWQSHNMKGNAIDFFMLVECRSFDEAMKILTAHQPGDIPIGDGIS